VSNTSTIFECYSGATLRTNLVDAGRQTWYLYNGTAESGAIAYTTPTDSSGFGVPGILFFNTSFTGRSQIRQYLSTGGVAIGAETGGTAQPCTQLVVLPNSHVFVTGYNSSDSSYVVDNGYTFNVTGTSCLSSSVLIGTITDEPSAKLIVESTTQGFLPPRMTNAQRTAISSPAIGLMIYQTDATEGLYINKSGGWTFII